MKHKLGRVCFRCRSGGRKTRPLPPAAPNTAAARAGAARRLPGPRGLKLSGREERSRQRPGTTRATQEAHLKMLIENFFIVSRMFKIKRLLELLRATFLLFTQTGLGEGKARNILERRVNGEANQLLPTIHFLHFLQTVLYFTMTAF